MQAVDGDRGGFHVLRVWWLCRRVGIIGTFNRGHRAGPEAERADVVHLDADIWTPGYIRIGFNVLESLGY